MVALHLTQDPVVNRAIIESGLNVQVAGDGMDHWAIVAKNRPVTRWTSPVLDCLNAVAYSLLRMPLSPDE